MTENQPEYSSARQRRMGKRRDSTFNFLTMLVLVGTVLFAVWGVWIYLHPESPLNPLPPKTDAESAVLPTRFVLPTQTDTPTQAPATSTAPAQALQPTRTFTPTVDLFLPPGVTPDSSAAVEGTPAGPYKFALQVQPVPMSAQIYPDLGCKFMGVAGQVFDLQGRPATGILVQLGGALDNKILLMTSLTGTALRYGQAGYEFSLADHPVSTRKSLWVRLVDQIGVPMSGKVVFDTYEDCEKNLILISFKQVR